jgi:hypothetical protein
VNSLERVGLDEELPTILQTIGWGKLYDEPHLGSCLLTPKFLMTIETVEKNRKSFVKFCLFGKSFGCDFSHLNALLDFFKSCLLESSAMRNFDKVEFSDAISGKFTRLRFSDIHNPSLRFLHRWMSFTLFPMVELRSVATSELKCLFAMVNRIKDTHVADFIDYFKNVHKMSGCSTHFLQEQFFLVHIGVHIKCISICSTDEKLSKNKSCIGCIAWHGILYFSKILEEPRRI